MVYFFLVGLTVLALWVSHVRWLRITVVLCHVAVSVQFGIYLGQVGRNTFEGVKREPRAVDTFEEGVFAESHAAESFAREQLRVVFVAASCLAALAIWPAIAKR